jgi:hypothetical protein
MYSLSKKSFSFCLKINLLIKKNKTIYLKLLAYLRKIAI